MKSNCKTKHRKFHVSWEGAEGILVKAHSFIGAMRAAFGPGQYEVAEALSEHQRRIKIWPTEKFFTVSLLPDENHYLQPPGDQL